MHPLRGATPVTGRYTRYGALHPNRRGVMLTDRVQCLQIGCSAPITTTTARNASPHTLSGSPRRSHTATQPHSHAATQPRDARPSSGLASQQKQSGRYTRYGALHHLGSLTPPPNWCNSALSGATPLGNKHNHENVPSRKEPRRLPLGNRRGLALTTQLSRSR